MSMLFGFFKRSSNMTGTEQLRGFKVTTMDRSRKIGIACHNLQELKEKACNKLEVPLNEDIRIFLLDGSEIDEEYFTTLKPQTTLVIKRPGEKLLSDADILYELLKKVNEEYLDSGSRAADFLTDKLKIKLAILNKALKNDDKKTHCSKRQDHPEWFEGLDTSASTKEAYLHRRCQDRIRGYLYKTIEQIKSSDVYGNNSKARKHLLQVIAFFKLQLKLDHYFGHYFDRKCAIDSGINSGTDNDDTDGPENICYEHCPCEQDVSLYDKYILGLQGNDIDAVDAKKIANNKEKDEEDDYSPYDLIKRNKNELIAFCDNRGQFQCGGQWNHEKCAYRGKHKINPYRSREELILFSTWNLDHRIERSRTLIPQILEASMKNELTQEDVVEFYNNIFTSKNLRLVHIVCHDKGSHK